MATEGSGLVDQGGEGEERPLVLIAGRSGQVATALAALDPADLHLLPLGRPELDLAEPNGASIKAALERHRPAAIVNAAAYTAVDRAEDEPDEAMAINARGAGLLAEASAAVGVPVVHLSTDYVFDGSLDRPYWEDDPTAPLGVYGRSKLEGERAVTAATPDHCILRTAWVHAPYGGNFVRTMLRLAQTRDELRVVNDQRGTPSYAPDLADAIVIVLRHLLARPVGAGEGSGRGMFHLAGTGETTWAGLAEAAFEASAKRGGPNARVVPIPAVEYPTPAARPANSRLDTSRFQRTFEHVPPHWRDAIERSVSAMLERGLEREAG